MRNGTFWMTFTESNAACDMGRKVGWNGRVLSNSTEGWNSHLDLIGELGVIYIYKDYRQVLNDKGELVDSPAIKVGDGKAYLIDLPFADDWITNHINDTTIHITQEEREAWNDKTTLSLDVIDEENLIFTKE